MPNATVHNKACELHDGKHALMGDNHTDLSDWGSAAAGLITPRKGEWHRQRKPHSKMRTHGCPVCTTHAIAQPRGMTKAVSPCTRPRRYVLILHSITSFEGTRLLLSVCPRNKWTLKWITTPNGKRIQRCEKRKMALHQKLKVTCESHIISWALLAYSTSQVQWHILTNNTKPPRERKIYSLENLCSW